MFFFLTMVYAIHIVTENNEDRSAVAGPKGFLAVPRSGKGRYNNHIIIQLHPWAGGAYGSSPLPTDPHTDGTYRQTGVWNQITEASLMDVRGGLSLFCSN